MRIIIIPFLSDFSWPNVIVAIASVTTTIQCSLHLQLILAAFALSRIFSAKKTTLYALTVNDDTPPSYVG